MTTVLAVDGNSLGHRAWHALRDHRNGDAWLTGGVVRMLASTWLHGPFDAVVAAFDSAGSIRQRSYPAYKANRDGHDPALHEQLDRLADLLDRCGFEVITSPGYEADDLLAATARACTAAGVRCTVLSSDRDLLALVSDDVTLLRPRRTMADLGVYTPAEVRAEFGVEPEQYPSLAALRGDPSDGLAGVPGIGAKTAARLLVSYGTLEALYAGVADLPDRLRDALRAARPDVERNLVLMSPLGRHEVDVVGAVARGIDLDRVTEALGGAGLAAAASELRLAVERGPLPPRPPPPSEDTSDYAGAPVRPLTRPVPAAVRGEQAPLFDP